MVQMIWNQVRRRGLRSGALFLAIVIAALGFTVLTASSSASKLKTVGTVNDMSRTNYDILVRPRGARAEVESADGVIEPGFLSGVFGGITLDQWNKIRAIGQVDVAAPIAMVGYAVPMLRVPVDLTTALPRRDSVGRVDSRWLTDNGLSSQSSPPDFAFVTTKHLRFLQDSPSEVWGIRDRGSERAICPSITLARGVPNADRKSILTCMSRDGSGDERETYSLPSASVGTAVSFPFPFLIAAVDPESEQKLSGLNDALTAGQPLDGAPLDDVRSHSGHAVPVLVGDTAQTQLRLTVTTSLLPQRAVEQVLNDASGDDLRSSPSRRLSSQTYTSTDLYKRLLEVLKTSGSDYWDANNISQLFTISTPDFTAGPDGSLIPRIQPNAVTEHFIDPDTQAAPPTMDDVSVRSGQYAEGPPGSQGGLPQPATLRYRGTFNPSALNGLSDLTDQLLSGLAPVAFSGSDAESKKALGDEALAPAPNVTGLAQPAPLMLTSLSALGPLQHGWTGRLDELGQEPRGARTEGAPISAIRVRVNGVTGVDEVSRERVRVVAEKIHAETGLDVDVTVGSSPYQQQIQLPPGGLGRPRLALNQWWLRKGVATAIIEALDRKSLAVFSLVLLVSVLSVANSTTASVRARRRELGILACLGWRRRDLLKSVLGELLLVSLVAGAMAGLGALLIGLTTGLPVSAVRATLALPASLLVATLAGLIPAALATRVSPIEATRGTVTQRARPTRLRNVATLGLSNLRRTRARTVLAALGLAVAVAAFTVLLAVTVAFQGTAVGTVMGHSATIQVRTVDYVAAAATLLLAVMGIANVMLLNIRDRGSEIAVLQSVGWTDRAVAHLVVMEGLGLGVLGSVAGLLLGLSSAAALTDDVTAPTVAAGFVAMVIGLAATSLAGLVPIALLRRIPTSTLLTEEAA